MSEFSFGLRTSTWSDFVTLTGLPFTADSGRAVPVTPSLMKALCDFLTNCLRLNWGTYLGGPGQQLAISLFR